MPATPAPATEKPLSDALPPERVADLMAVRRAAEATLPGRVTGVVLFGSRARGDADPSKAQDPCVLASRPSQQHESQNQPRGNPSRLLSLRNLSRILIKSKVFVSSCDFACSFRPYGRARNPRLHGTSGEVPARCSSTGRGYGYNEHGDH